MEKVAPHQSIRFARHIAGMAIVAAANPLIYFSSDKFSMWAFTWITPLVFAAVVYALYALFFTQRAKLAWPRSFFILAWVILLLAVAGPYLDKINRKMTTGQQHRQPVAHEEATESEIDAELKTAPPYTSSHPTQLLTDEEIGLKGHNQNSGQVNQAASYATERYIQRVNALRRAAETGVLPTVTTRQKSSTDNMLGPWPAADVDTVESTQTWWIADGLVFIHVTNHSVYKVDAVQFAHTHSACGTSTPEGQSSYVVHLQRSIPPSSEALIHFPAGNIKNGCLTIEGILG
jgi:hypothetical protein